MKRGSDVDSEESSDEEELGDDDSEGEEEEEEDSEPESKMEPDTSAKRKLEEDETGAILVFSLSKGAVEVKVIGPVFRIFFC